MRLVMKPFEKRRSLISLEVALSINIVVAIFGYYVMMIILRGSFQTPLDVFSLEA
jgi:hypothetical protein